MENKKLYKEFLRIAEALNNSLQITPVLYGSLGLEIITSLNFSPNDIDILVPRNFIDEDWSKLKQTMLYLGYELVDLHEHKFTRDTYEVGFAFEEDLLPFANVQYDTLQVITDQNIIFKLLTAEEYLFVYKRSVLDSYRGKKNNYKDLQKIEILEKFLLS